jgi:hypothetical protein
MRSIKLLTVSVAASLLLGAVAHASDAVGVRVGNATKTTAVTAPRLPWDVGSLQRVSVAGPQRYPGLHWTSVIGTGTAGSLER